MTDIVLINPPSCSYREHLHEGFQYPHTGLGYLQENLLKNSISSIIIDAKFNIMTPLECAEKALDYNPKLIGITSRTFDSENAYKVAKIIKKYSNIPIVLGGNHASALPYHILRNYPFLDFIIKGEGEVSLVKLFNNLKSCEFNDIPGLFYRNKNTIIKSKDVKPINLNKLPFPKFCDYTAHSKRIFIMATRGCPYKCIFCSSYMGYQLRKREISSVIEELLYHSKNSDFDLIEFSDESFTLDKKYFYELMIEIRKNGLHKKIRWAASTRVDLINQKILLEMKKSGCELVIFGSESGDEKILLEWNKEITKKQVQKAIALAKKAGLKTDVNFILGAPHESYKSLISTVLFIAKLNPTYASVSIGAPYPKTKYNFLASINHGGLRLIAKKFSDYNNQIGNAMELEHISRKKLEIFQLLSYTLFFIINLRFKDLFNFIYQFKREAFFFIKKLLF